MGLVEMQFSSKNCPLAQLAVPFSHHDLFMPIQSNLKLLPNPFGLIRDPRIPQEANA